MVFTTCQCIKYSPHWHLYTTIACRFRAKRKESTPRVKNGLNRHHRRPLVAGSCAELPYRTTFAPGEKTTPSSSRSSHHDQIVSDAFQVKTFYSVEAVRPTSRGSIRHGLYSYAVDDRRRGRRDAVIPQPGRSSDFYTDTGARADFRD